MARWNEPSLRFGPVFHPSIATGCFFRRAFTRRIAKSGSGAARPDHWRRCCSYRCSSDRRLPARSPLGPAANPTPCSPMPLENPPAAPLRLKLFAIAGWKSSGASAESHPSRLLPTIFWPFVGHWQETPPPHSRYRLTATRNRRACSICVWPIRPINPSIN